MKHPRLIAGVMKPKLRILRDEDGWHYCGLFGGGYFSSVGAVRRVTLSQALRFYFRVLACE